VGGGAEYVGELLKNFLPAVLRIRIWIRKDPYHFSGSGSVPVCLGSGSLSYSNGTTKLTGRKNLTKNTFCVGPVGPTDKENRAKIYKKYCFRYITSLKRQESGSMSNWKPGSVSK
jgi:hypothetical protein